VEPFREGIFILDPERAASTKSVDSSHSRYPLYGAIRLPPLCLSLTRLLSLAAGPPSPHVALNRVVVAALKPDIASPTIASLSGPAISMLRHPQSHRYAAHVVAGITYVHGVTGFASLPVAASSPNPIAATGLHSVAFRAPPRQDLDAPAP
jgi:hypothetical protein